MSFAGLKALFGSGGEKLKQGKVFDAIKDVSLQDWGNGFGGNIKNYYKGQGYDENTAIDKGIGTTGALGLGVLTGGAASGMMAGAGAGAGSMGAGSMGTGGTAAGAGAAPNSFMKGLKYANQAKGLFGSSGESSGEDDLALSMQEQKDEENRKRAYAQMVAAQNAALFNKINSGGQYGRGF